VIDDITPPINQCIPKYGKINVSATPTQNPTQVGHCISLFNIEK